MQSAKAHEAVKVRDGALAVLEQQGKFIEVGGLRDKVLSAEIGAILMVHRTPFQKLPVPATYSGAVAAHANLPYGLDIWWKSKKVFSLEWDDAEFVIGRFNRGEWEGHLSPQTV